MAKKNTKITARAGSFEPRNHETFPWVSFNPAAAGFFLRP